MEKNDKTAVMDQFKIFSNMLEGIAVYKLVFNDKCVVIDGILKYINHAALKAMNLNQEDVIGKTVTELFDSDYIESYNEIINEYRATGEYKRLETYYSPTDKYFLISGFDMDDNLFAILRIDITEQKMAEEELRQVHIYLEEQIEKRTNELKNAYKELEDREKSFSSLLLASSEVLYRVSPDWNVMLHLNSPGFLANTEKPNRNWLQEYVPPEDQPNVIAAFNEAIQTKGVYELEHRVIQADGNVGWTFSRAIPIIDKNGEIVEWFGAASDITEQKKAVNALEESENRYRNIIDNIPDAYFRGDNEGIITMVSPSTARMYRFDSPQEMIGQPILSLYKYPEDRRYLLEGLKKNGKVEDYEFKSVRKDSTSFWVSINAQYHYDNNGQIQGTEGFVRDITKRKKAESELKKALNDIKRSNEELQQFAYVASHDLQEPLRTIASFTQLLERRYKGKLDQDADEFMEYIVDAAVRMKQQINDLLGYSRVATAGKEFEKVDTNSILNQATANLKSAIDENNAEITHDPLPNVIGDRDQLSRVFQNLIGNAIKYRKPDEPPKIHISAHENKGNNEYVFSVSDNGIGIKKEYLDRIFIVFQRLHTKDEYKGTGIGLSVVKKVIERHGGYIWVESEYGKGSTFYFTIPIK